MKVMDMNLPIESDDIIGEIEHVQEGKLVGWVAAKDDSAPIEILAATPDAHINTVANAYRPDILFKSGLHGYSGFSISLGALVTLRSPPTSVVKIFFSSSARQRTVVEIPFETASLLRSRYNFQFSKIGNGQIKGRYSAEFDRHADQASPPTFSVRNANGEEAVALFAKCLEGFTWDLIGRVPLSKVINAMPLSLSVISHVGEVVAPDPIGFDVYYDVSANDDIVSGWAICPIDSSARVSVKLARLSDPDEIVAETRATLFRSDLKAITNTDGFYGFQVPRPQGEDLVVSLSSGLTDQKIRLVLNWPTTKPEAE